MCRECSMNPPCRLTREVLQRLMVSTTPSWQDVSKWYWELEQTASGGHNAGDEEDRRRTDRRRQDRHG